MKQDIVEGRKVVRQMDPILGTILANVNQNKLAQRKETKHF